MSDRTPDVCPKCGAGTDKSWNGMWECGAYKKDNPFQPSACLVRQLQADLATATAAKEQAERERDWLAETHFRAHVALDYHGISRCSPHESHVDVNSGSFRRLSERCVVGVGDMKRRKLAAEADAKAKGEKLTAIEDALAVNMKAGGLNYAEWSDYWLNPKEFWKGDGLNPGDCLPDLKEVATTIAAVLGILHPTPEQANG